LAPRPLRHADQGARGADVAGDAVHGQQERAVSARDERAAQQQVNEQAVTPPSDGAGQPQAAAHVQRERRPHRSPAHAHPDLVGLDLPRLHPAHPLVVQQGGVRPRLVQPRPHRALVQPAGGHDRRDGAAVDEQRAHERHGRRRVVQPIERRIGRCRAGAPAGAAALAPLDVGMDADVARADRPLVGARQMGA